MNYGIQISNCALIQYSGQNNILKEMIGCKNSYAKQQTDSSQTSTFKKQTFR